MCLWKVGRQHEGMIQGWEGDGRCEIEGRIMEGLEGEMCIDMDGLNVYEYMLFDLQGWSQIFELLVGLVETLKDDDDYELVEQRGRVMKENDCEEQFGSSQCVLFE